MNECDNTNSFATRAGFDQSLIDRIGQDQKAQRPIISHKLCSSDPRAILPHQIPNAAYFNSLKKSGDLLELSEKRVTDEHFTLSSE
ncbi:unnamed protein product [Larinioides sclopetarius]|uniref:Uncharacterized protein n=1 Tax=Larinioides sclopetarius TaxID=280406 RepID=A0AAV1ZJ24_9ARAC